MKKGKVKLPKDPSLKKPKPNEFINVTLAEFNSFLKAYEESIRPNNIDRSTVRICMPAVIFYTDKTRPWGHLIEYRLIAKRCVEGTFFQILNT